MFLEASVYDVRQVPSEERKNLYGFLVLTMRTWPRGISKNLVDMWIKDAAPSLETLNAFRQGLLTLEAFEQCYSNELRARQSCVVRSYVGLSHEEVVEQEYACSPLAHLRDVEKRHKKVTILCWEPKPPCHRFFLLRWLEGA
jgi:uncharacterized protein YeaO (DUF488 family)